jgi:hypothetical protein
MDSLLFGRTSSLRGSVEFEQLVYQRATGAVCDRRSNLLGLLLR